MKKNSKTVSDKDQFLTSAKKLQASLAELERMLRALLISKPKTSEPPPAAKLKKSGKRSVVKGGKKIKSPA